MPLRKMNAAYGAVEVVRIMMSMSTPPPRVLGVASAEGVSFRLSCHRFLPVLSPFSAFLVTVFCLGSVAGWRLGGRALPLYCVLAVNFNVFVYFLSFEAMAADGALHVPCSY